MKEGYFFDTGQWKLIISISSASISAVLIHTTDPEAEPVMLLYRRKEDKKENLLHFIENAIYDTPRILEDFSTHILVSTPKALWIPAEYTEDEEFDPDLYTCVYPAEQEDIFSDFDERETCLYSLTPGLNPFLQRTIPGCRISSHLSILKSCFSEAEAYKTPTMDDKDGIKTVYACIREGMADIFAFQDGIFLCGAVHEWKENSDIAYSIMLIADTYGFLNREADLILYGNESEAERLESLLAEYFKSISYRTSPSLSPEWHLPMEMAIAAGLSF